MRFASAGTALILGAAAALAQERTEALPTFSESVEVRVLDLDVDVTDAKGKPVADLNREDFQVRVGGKVVPIEYFARVEQGAIHAPDLLSAPPDDVLAAYRKSSEAFVPRNFLIYIDLGYLPPGQRSRSLNALRDLVTRLGPNDAVRIVVFDRIPTVVVDWTTSKESAMAALSAVERKGVGMSRLQAQRQAIAQIDQSSAAALGRRISSGASPRMQVARAYAEQTGAEIQTMLDSMRQELITLTPLNGKRAFLFLTGGFEIQPGYVMAQYAAANQPTLTNLDVREIPKRVTALAERANAFGVTFYTVDGTGLTNDAATAETGPLDGSQNVFQNRANLAFQARQDRQDGLRILARDTGGVALLNTNDFEGGLGRIYQDVSTYYSVGVNLAQLGGKGYQQVDVTVNRPGVSVRTRRGFEQLPESEIIGDHARATLETDLSYAAIPAKIIAAPATQEKSMYVLPITVALPASGLTFIPEGDKAVAHAEFYIGAIDDRGRTSDISRQSIAFTLPADKAQGDSMLRFDAKLDTKKGNYRIVVNVRDVATGKMGTARANVRVE